MQNVFLTPLEISDSIKMIFRQADIEGAVSGDGAFALKCDLSEGVPPFYIQRAIDALQFVPALKDLYNRAVIASVSQKPKEYLTLDIERFSLMTPLSNWKLFQRRLFKESGRNSEDLLLAYLTQEGGVKQEILKILTQLGLAPEQIGHTIQEEDKEVLISFCEKMNKIPENTPILSALKHEYPLIESELVTLFVERELHKERMSVPQKQTRILQTLKERVVGQDEVSNILCSAICDGENKNKKFLFVGPTGTGKTEMSKVVADMMGGRFLTLAMNTYSQGHSVSNLFGSPVGYVGSSDKPSFIKMIEEYKPQRVESGPSGKVFKVTRMVVLFDELEKAASEVKQSLLTLFDEGHITCTYTSESLARPLSGSNIVERYVFEDSIFIGTSNLFSQEILGFFRAGKSFQDTKRMFIEKNTTNRSYSSFSAEFLGRFSVVPFGPIPRGVDGFQKIIKQNMKNFLDKTKQIYCLENLKIEREQEVLEIMENSLYSEGIGIRRVQQYFESNINTTIHTKILTEIPLDGKTLVLFPFDESRIGIRIEKLVFGRVVTFSGPFSVDY